MGLKITLPPGVSVVVDIQEKKRQVVFELLAKTGWTSGQSFIVI